MTAKSPGFDYEYKGVTPVIKGDKILFKFVDDDEIEHKATCTAALASQFVSVIKSGPFKDTIVTTLYSSDNWRLAKHG